MAYDPNILRRAAARLEEQKRQREDRREELRRKAYAREPRLAQLDRQLQRTMAELASASLRQGGDMRQTLQARCCWGPWACPRTPWTTSPPAPSAGTPAGGGPRCASV